MKSSTRMSGAERRDQLLNVARERFAADGYRTTTADVARIAGVSEALVIKHFGTKSDLFRAAVAEPLIDLLERTLETGLALGAAPSGPAVTPADQLDHLCRFGDEWIALIANNRTLILSMVRETGAFPDVAAHVMKLVDGIMNDVIDSLSLFADTDDYQDFDPKVTTVAALGALTAAAMTLNDTAGYARTYFEMVFQGVLSDSGRARMLASTGRQKA